MLENDLTYIAINQDSNYKLKKSCFESLKSTKNASIVMLGDSILANGEWVELLTPYKVINRAIGG